MLLRCFGWVLTTLAASPCAPAMAAGAALPEARLDPGVLAVDLDDPPETRIRLTPFLTFGAVIQTRYDYERNFDLADSSAGDRSRVTPELSLALSYDPDPRIQVFVSLELAKEFGSRDGGERSPETRLDLAQAYFRLTDLAGSGVHLQVGRQRIEDDREWLYDEELDAVRVMARAGRFTLEGSVSREDLVDRNLLPHDQPPADPINNYIADVTYSPAEDGGIAAYVVVRDDQSGSGERPWFVGLHGSGEAGAHLTYWIDLAHVRGHSGSKRIRGWGGDVGSTYGFDAWLHPSLSIGFAVGSGDADPNDEIDRAFRQTGLADNTDELNGLSSIKYYGELVDPDLSNLQILTVSAGVSPTSESSLEAVYHHYLQDHASNDLASASIERDPAGESPRLGSEIDVVAAYRGLQGLELEVTLGYFMPGPAFLPAADNAFLAGLDVQFEF